MHDGVWLVVVKPYGLETDGGDFGGQRLGSDDQHPRARCQLVGQHVSGALRARDDVLGGRLKAEVSQVLGDFVGATRRIVGDE